MNFGLMKLNSDRVLLKSFFYDYEFLIIFAL